MTPSQRDGSQFLKKDIPWVVDLHLKEKRQKEFAIAGFLKKMALRKGKSETQSGRNLPEVQPNSGEC